MRLLEQNIFVFLGAIWAVFIAISVAVMPLLPVDETRYMTVAWEMYLKKSWILPTLNFEPYSHKPPMLFWTINAVWQVTGLEIWGVRIMNGLIAFASIPLTYILAKNLFPEKMEIWKIAPVILMASPIFFIYGTLIMFDFLQTIFVMLSLLFVGKIEKSNKMMFWILFGLTVGLGILAKGPVMFIHVMFPVLFAPFWGSKRSAGKWAIWYIHLALSIAVAAVVSLSWALPAADLGGEIFSDEIFWSQSVGRMSVSFAHQKPFWFYAPIILVAFLPLVLWPHTWKTFRRKIPGPASSTRGFRFLLSWIVPVFLAFSFISGKQIHYLIPVLPGVALMLAYFVDSKMANDKDIEIPFWGFLAFFVVLHLAPLFFGAAGFGEIPFYVSTIDARSNLLSTTFVGVFIVASFVFRDYFDDSTKGHLIFFVVSSFLLTSLFSLQMSRKGYDYYDLEPLAEAIQPFRDKPVAISRKYRGELGFLAKIEKSIENVSGPDLAKWFDANPEGVVIYRYNKNENKPEYEVIFEMPYKSRSHVALVSSHVALVKR